jgi:hypothetical protein
MFLFSKKAKPSETAQPLDFFLSTFYLSKYIAKLILLHDCRDRFR